ncbi:MAG: conjugal transfer protein TraH [Candidatus Thiodiazotropha sp. LLP2]|nr:conjugal transfer protein TraH [Candidatus Thiodiazotropha lotti]MCW4216796.1 conjugal transfer protein TraH [Candidatus Thiodiazotropha lotti]
MKRRIVAATALTLTLLTSPSYADVGSDMNNFFTDMGYASNVTPPGVYEGQAAGYFTGGGLVMRAPSRNYQLASMQAPSYRAGCSGVDLYGGGFSYINSAQLVAALRNVGQNAASYAFMLGLRVISPQISNVLEWVREKAEMINKLNINSCEAAADLVGSFVGLDAKENSQCVLTRYGNGDSMEEARQACGAGGQRNSTLASSSLNSVAFTRGNIAWRVMWSNMFLRSDKRLMEMMMNLSGTVIIDKDLSNENSPTNVIALPSILNTQRAELLTALLDGSQSVDIQGCVNDSTDMTCTNLTTKTVSLGVNNGLKDRVQTIMTSIADKIRNRQSLSPTELGLLGATKIPIYKILNVASAMSDTVAGSQADKYSDIVAKDIMFAYINDLLDMVVSSTAGTPFMKSDEGKSYMEGIAEARQQVALLKSENFEELSRYVDLIRETQLYERMLVATMSPALAESLRYTNSLR